MTKQIGELLPSVSLTDKFGRVNTMKSFLGIDEIHSALGRSFKDATKLSRELPTDIEMESISPMWLSSISEDSQIKAQEALQNTDLDKQEILS